MFLLQELLEHQVQKVLALEKAASPLVMVQSQPEQPAQPEPEPSPQLELVPPPQLLTPGHPEPQLEEPPMEPPMEPPVQEIARLIGLPPQQT